MLNLLCGQLFMYCTLDTSSLGIWALLMMQFMYFCGLSLIYHSSMEVYNGSIIPFYSEFLPHRRSQSGFEA